MKNIEFKAFKGHRATDLVESRISNMIIKGTIGPGKKLPTEKELSEKFDVSIVTTREALRGLQVAGLIQKKRGKNGGIFATEINNDSVRMAISNYLKRREFTSHHLAEVRLNFEPTIIKIAASRITFRELADLEDNIISCEKKLEKAHPNIPLKDYYDIGQKNVDFHRLIAKATHNPVFTLTLDYIMDFITEFKNSVFTPDIVHCTRVVQSHRDIFNSLKDGDAEEASSKMLSHLGYVEVYQTDDPEDSAKPQ
jgi:GntR family transcriptional regulator, transcriptional repressor for pyruvate dehydrogenase complex